MGNMIARGVRTKVGKMLSFIGEDCIIIIRVIISSIR